ncbi:response regulator [Sphingomonas sp. RB3P16]|uniref:response regulator n=1 Tax=Parasphingomonas frigoris TaxID=3096163 RepID=UPI002FC7C730
MENEPLPTVLLVEDEVLIRIVAADMLTDSGFTVLEAGDAAEALEMLATHKDIGVLFTDVNMPGQMDGIELAAQVVRLHPEIKVIVTSGRQWLEDDSLPDHGRFLKKPYGQRELTEMVREQVSAPS